MITGFLPDSMKQHDAADVPSAVWIVFSVQAQIRVKVFPSSSSAGSLSEQGDTGNSYPLREHWAPSRAQLHLKRQKVKPLKYLVSDVHVMVQQRLWVWRKCNEQVYHGWFQSSRFRYSWLDSWLSFWIWKCCATLQTLVLIQYQAN